MAYNKRMSIPQKANTKKMRISNLASELKNSKVC